MSRLATPPRPQGLKDTVASVLEGCNATVFAYGQTVSKDMFRLPCTAVSALLGLLGNVPPPTPPRLPALQGSGKTHTLLGDVSSPTERGVVPRAVAELAQGMARHPECRFKVCGRVPCGCCGGRVAACRVGACMVRRLEAAM